MRKTKTLIALDAVTANTTSKKYEVGGATRIGILLRRANHSSGSSAFTVKGSMDPVGTTSPTMTDLNMLIDNVTNDNSEGITRVNGKTLNSDSDAFLWVDTNCIVNWLEVSVAHSTDGVHTAHIIAEYED